MSAATVATAAAAPAATGGKKKLLIFILAAVLLLSLAGGGAAFFLLKKTHVAEDDLDSEDGAAQTEAQAPKAKPKHDASHPPTFLPLEPFTVNLADHDTDRYAQIAVTLEIDDPKTGDELKAYMPAIRNNILMVLAHKTAAQLLSREGKEQLARSILYASVRPLGFKIEDDTDEPAKADDGAPKKKKKRVPSNLPVSAVHFSNFIVQ